MTVIRHGVRVTFDSVGFPTIVGSVAGGPIRELAQHGGKTVEYAPADQLRGAVRLLDEAEPLLREAADMLDGGEHAKRFRALADRVATRGGQ